MIIKENENLAKYTTVRIGGTAAKLFVPENVKDLQDIIKEQGMLPMISGGSNLLINDEKVFDAVVFLGKFDEGFTIDEYGNVTAGASLRLQKLINSINEKGFGGIEYLYSVPGMLGGAIYMNAGRGSDKKSISDYLISVTAINNRGEIVVLTKEECRFTYRKSIFMKNNMIILSAVFKFPKQSIEESKKNIAERLETCKKFQDNSKPNFGSVFCKYNVKIMNFVKKHRKLFGNKPVHFSDKSVNWIVNEGEGSFRDAKKCIDKITKIHKLFRKDIEVEVRIME